LCDGGRIGASENKTITSIPIQEDDHLRIVLRYIERNALRASLAARAEHWPWSSLWTGTPKP
jgi:hypothetical protein